MRKAVSDLKRMKTRPIGSELPGGYEIFDVKRGGMGIVYLVYHPDLNVGFAVKTFQDKYLMDHSAVERFRREGKTWIRLGQHSHIVRAIFIKRIDNRPHIFLEYVDGSNLRERMHHGKMGLREAVDVAMQLCDGMAYAHSKLGIVHRDIKPENVMLTDEGVAKVTDFGLVSAAARTEFTPGSGSRNRVKLGDPAVTQLGEGMGTPGYMAPEQWTAASQVDTRADIYSFGIVLYEMLCGRRPFRLHEGEPVHALYTRQLEQSPPHRSSLAGLPDALKDVVVRCLEREPARRFDGFNRLGGKIAEVYQSLFGQAWSPPAPTAQGQGQRATQLAMEGMSLASLDDHKAAIRALDEALAVKPADGLFLQLKGRSCRALGEHAQAMQCFRQVEAFDPDTFETHDDMAFCLNEMKQHEEALCEANRSIELEPENFSSWNNKAIALGELGRISEAVPALQKALDLDPRCAEAWNNLGFLLGRSGKMDEAISCLRKAIDLNPRYLQPYYNWGELLVMMGRSNEALAVVDRVLVIEPANKVAQRIRSRLVGLVADHES